jgi:hypothetical protein
MKMEKNLNGIAKARAATGSTYTNTTTPQGDEAKLYLIKDRLFYWSEQLGSSLNSTKKRTRVLSF